MFSGDTVSAYVAHSVPRYLSRSLGTGEYDRSDPESVSRHLLRLVELPTFEIDSEAPLSGVRPLAGTDRVRIEIHLPGLSQEDAARVLELSPNPSLIIRDALQFEGNRLVAPSVRAADAQRVWDAVHENLRRLNAEVGAARESLARMVHEAVARHFASLVEEQRKRTASIEALRATGIPFINDDLPAERIDAATVETAAREQRSSREAELREAVALVRATTTTEHRLRAIRTVRAALADWRDRDADRAFLANVVELGLEAMETELASDRPNDLARRAILATLQLNIKHAISWANDNQYLQFAKDLWLVLEVVEKLA